MKNKIKKSVFLFTVLAFLTITFYSCQNGEVSIEQNNLVISKNTISQKYSLNFDKVLIKIITSKGFLAFEKASSDYESIKLKKNDKSKEALTKVQAIKNMDDYHVERIKF